VVALSMALSPVLLLIHDRLSARAAGAQRREYDAIEGGEAQIIMAGFGRYGQIVGRLLFASGHAVTVLDHDPDQVEFLRRFGFRVFYGDATRVDLLEAAGAARAKLLINAIDGIEDNLKLVDLAREHFPNLKILARARNVTHYFELRARGVEMPERETFEAALVTARGALQALGIAPYEARELADRFRTHNIRMLRQMEAPYQDETSRLSAARAGREELEAQFERDRLARDRWAGGGWHEELDAVADEHAQPTVNA
ncbi:MAG: NAD-binding protein, partial [Polyangiales bacterium]